MHFRFFYLIFFLVTSFSAYSRDFTDRELKRVLLKNNKGLIYIWSPGMPLSEKGLIETQRICEQLNISFIPVSDPFSYQLVKDPYSYDELRSESLLSPMKSAKLQSMGVMNHFPAIIFFNNKKVIRPIIHGYEEPKGMRNFIKTYLQIEEK